MIVVRVELWSAVDGSRTELARMRISNDGVATRDDPRFGDYQGETLRGRSTEALNAGLAQRKGAVCRFNRKSLHVWHLVGRMLAAMGYVEPTPSPEPEQQSIWAHET